MELKKNNNNVSSMAFHPLFRKCMGKMGMGGMTAKIVFDGANRGTCNKSSAVTCRGTVKLMLDAYFILHSYTSYKNAKRNSKGEPCHLVILAVSETSLSVGTAG